MIPLIFKPPKVRQEEKRMRRKSKSLERLESFTYLNIFQRDTYKDCDNDPLNLKLFVTSAISKHGSRCGETILSVSWERLNHRGIHPESLDLLSLSTQAIANLIY